MSEDVSVMIEGEDAPRERGAKQQAAAVNPEQDLRTVLADRAAAFRERDLAVRENLAVRASALEQEQLSAREYFKSAYEAGNAEELLAAQEAMQGVDQKRAALIREAQWAEQRARASAHSDNPVENYVARSGISQRSAAFLRQNPNLVGNEQKLLAAHHAALAAGHQNESDGYYSHVKQFAGGGEGTGDEVMSPRARAEAPPRASEPKRGKVTVKLSREDHERLKDTAESLGMPFNTYLARYIAMRDDPAWNWRVNDGASS
jgi:predicted HicB family RNase H-like nuclease